jgi:hypothetical protein
MREDLGNQRAGKGMVYYPIASGLGLSSRVLHPGVKPPGLYPMCCERVIQVLSLLLF